MLGFVARRVLLLLPTLLVVLLLTFLLSKFASGDEVYSRLILEGQSTQFSIDQYEKTYKAEERKLGLHLPSFYLSILPHYSNKLSEQIVPKLYRESLNEINNEVKDWGKVDQYHKQLIKLRYSLEGKALYRSLNNQLAQLQKAKSITDLHSYLPALRSYEGEDIKLQIDPLVAAIENLSVSSAFPIPNVRWNGSENQFHFWVSHLFDSNSRKSLVDGQSVNTKVINALKWTLSLSLISLVIAIAISLLIAMWQISKGYEVVKKLVSGLLYAFYAIPLFWLATLAVVFLTTDDYGSWTNVFPSIGIRYWDTGGSFWSDIRLYTGQLILPVLCIVMVSIAYLSRQLVSDLQREIAKPYVISVKSKGVDDNRLRWHHLLPNALLPYITIITGAIPRTIVGSAIIETIFNIPGIGKLLLDSIYYNDWPVSFTIVLLVGVVTVLSYILADVLYVIFYPKMAEQIIKG